MQVPKRKDVEPVPRHFIEELAPERLAPHLGDVRLEGVAVVRVTRCPQIERDIELDAALRDVWPLFVVRQTIERAQSDRLGDVQSAIHGAHAVAAGDAQSPGSFPVQPVTLRAERRVEVKPDTRQRSDRFGRSRGQRLAQLSRGKRHRWWVVRHLDRAVTITITL
jgi:hypothetical protein